MTPKRAAALATRHAIDRASIDAARARQAVSAPSSWWAQPALTWEQFSTLAEERAREVNSAFAAQHTPRRDEP